MNPEVLRQILDARLEGVFTACPGIVKSYDAATQTADVQPALQHTTRALDDDEPDLVESLPILARVPVLWPRGGGQFLHFPLSVGDSVLLVFCQQDTNAWIRDGGEVDPGTSDRHGLSGAVAVPGLFPASDALSGPDQQFAQIGTDGGALVEFRPAEIRAGGSEALVKAAAIDLLSSVFDTWNPTGTLTDGTALKALLTAMLLNPVWTGRSTTVLKGS